MSGGGWECQMDGKKKKIGLSRWLVASQEMIQSDSAIRLKRKWSEDLAPAGLAGSSHFLLKVGER